MVTDTDVMVPAARPAVPALRVVYTLANAGKIWRADNFTVDYSMQ